VLQQYRLQSLNDELANGRPGDLDRTYGGLRLLPPSGATAS
jgi:glucose-1-phosphate adenylyltransferase